MNEKSLSVNEVFNTERFAKTWIVPASRELTGVADFSEAAGYLNPLRNKPLQLISENESEWVYGQSETNLVQSPPFADTVVAIVMSAGVSANPALVSVCEKNKIGLLKTGATTDDLMAFLRSTLNRLLSVHATLHGVFLGVMNVGVLITGGSGVGKSEVALDLVQRGHQLVADDAVIFQRQNERLLGSCPELLRGYLEIRGLGIVHVEKMFGPSALLDVYPLDLIVRLESASDRQMQSIDRLSPSLQEKQVLGVAVEELTMLVAPGRNLAVLVEAAVRDYRLRLAGVNTSIDFIESHQRTLEGNEL
jgi:HPr kinase/phosphorylase